MTGPGELVRLDDRALPAETRSNGRASGLRGWAEELSFAADIANGLVGTPFVPDTMHVLDDRGQLDYAATSAVVAAALLTGAELGLDPMASLRSVDIIKGTPALRALAMRALVRHHGARIWTAESTSLRAIVRGQAVGEDNVEESVWDMQRARDLGLAGRPNWRAQPKVMLLARATAEVARLVAPEALLGLPYAVEELGDPRRAAPAREDTEQRPAARTARRRTIPRTAAAAGPPAQPDPEQDGGQQRPPQQDDAAPGSAHTRDPDPPKLSQAQRNKMHALFRDLDISDRKARLALSAQVVGRQLASANDLTGAEADKLIGDLERRVLRRQADQARQAVEDTQAGPDDPTLDDALGDGAAEADAPFDTPDPDLVD